VLPLTYPLPVASRQVQADLRSKGLDKCALILGVDFTKSNEWTGKVRAAPFGLVALGRDAAPSSADVARRAPGVVRGPLPARRGRQLCVARARSCQHYSALTRSGLRHTRTAGLNPYAQSIAILGRTLQAFDDDGEVPAYGFGDSTTSDTSVFSFFPRNRPAHGFSEALATYKTLAPCVKLAGPTSFGPIIRHAAAITAASGNKFHALLLIADGQVTRSSDLPDGELSPQEQDTVNAIVEASETVALAIIMVGVGDGPWEVMRAFDDKLPQRRFDNYQFVEFNDIVSNAAPTASGAYAYDAEFALACLQELPEQYKTVKRLEMLNRPQRPATVVVSVLEPPSGPPRGARASASAAAPPEPETCAVCLDQPRGAVLVPCGHAVLCVACAAGVMAAVPRRCPICRAEPQSSFRLYT
jgi:E3 ubiquitin-protein ligase RGLG